MKKIIVMIVLVLTLLLGLNTVDGYYSPETIHLDVTGIADNGEYTEDVTITFTEESATLNGVPFVSGGTVDKVGNYTLVLMNSGEEVNRFEFTILPRFTTPIQELTEVYDAFTIDLQNDALLQLNEEDITGPLTIDTIGDYNLVVTGVNGFQASYTIAVQDRFIEYIQTYDMYSDFTIDISLFEEVYYENELAEENITFDEIGHYQITVLYFNGLSETIDFTYAHTTNRFEDNGVYSLSLLLQKDTAQRWYIDNRMQADEVDSLFLTKVGKHTIKFTGRNEYVKYYTVTITEGDIGIQNGDVYEDFFQFKFTGYKVSLNGVNYISDTKKSGAGYYTLEVKGVNGYTSEYEIFIKEEVPFEKRSILDPYQVIDESITLDQDFDKIFVNGKEVTDFRFSQSGEYRIVYLGAGGYMEAYTVVYENQHEALNSTLFQGVIGLAAFVTITYLFLVWRRFK